MESAAKAISELEYCVARYGKEDSFTFAAYQALMEMKAMKARIDELSKDAARIDWLEKRALINSKGTRSEGLKQDFDAKFVVMPSWYQHGKEFSSLREAIDDAKERSACNSSL